MTIESDIRTAEKVLARVERGVPMDREIHSGEVMPVLRALAAWREAAYAAADAMKGGK